MGRRRGQFERIFQDNRPGAVLWGEKATIEAAGSQISDLETSNLAGCLHRRT